MPILGPRTVSVHVKPEGNFLYSLEAPYREELTRLLSGKYQGPPGTTFRDSPKRWIFGADLVPYVERVCRGVFGSCQVTRRSGSVASVEALTHGMHPFQLRGLEKILKDMGHALFFEQGLGKTRPAVVAARALGARRCLAIVPPKMVLDFTAEIKKWLGPDTRVWSPKKEGDCPSEDVEFAVIPVSKLHYTASAIFQRWLSGVELAIVDECQFYKSYKAQRSALLKQILSLMPQAVRVPMSGTPLPDRAADIYQPLDYCWPWVFGKKDAFNARYLLPEVNRGGYTEYRNLNGLYDAELAERIQTLSTRARKRDYAHLLPSFTLSRLEVEVSLPAGYQPAAEPTEKVALAEMALLKIPKAKAAVIRAGEIIENEAPDKLVVLTYHRDAAEAIAVRLADDHPEYEVTLIWGGLSDKDFQGRISRATDPAKRSILVANMSAIETGLNRLVCFSRGILAELYYRPATVSQALARFHRLTSRWPVLFDVLFCPGTLDSRIYNALRNKLDDIDKLIGSGDSESQLMGLDQDNWQAELAAALED